MSSALGTVRENIQAQGFCGLDDKTCAQINYPLRLPPAIRMAWAGRGNSARLAGTASSWDSSTLRLCLGDDHDCRGRTGFPGRHAPAMPHCRLVAAAFANVSTGFCIPSFIVRMFFGGSSAANLTA